MTVDFKTIYRKTISLLVVGYNKGVVLSRITRNSMAIIQQNLRRTYEFLKAIVKNFARIRTASERTNQSAQAISASINEIIKTNSAIKDAIHNNVSGISRTAEESRQMYDTFVSLVEKANQVATMTGEIENVAQQTNVLAINASIEAARAGQAGAGFKIIAHEVRNLSTKTQAFAGDIGQSIREFSAELYEVRKQVDELMELLGRFQKDMLSTESRFEENRANLEDSGKLISGIKEDLEEQNTAMNEGIDLLNEAFSLLKDAESISSNMEKTHKSLDSLLNRKI